MRTFPSRDRIRFRIRIARSIEHRYKTLLLTGLDEFHEAVDGEGVGLFWLDEKPFQLATKECMQCKDHSTKETKWRQLKGCRKVTINRWYFASLCCTEDLKLEFAVRRGRSQGQCSEGVWKKKVWHRFCITHWTKRQRYARLICLHRAHKNKLG